MKIRHIFNAIDKKHEEDDDIDSQEFKVEYWKNSKDGYNPPEDLSSDFSQMYYNALVPIKEDSIISKYDNEKLKRLVSTLGDELLLISGDFWGIQKFIFNGVTTSKASKILRSRSAMVQLITYAVVDKVKKEFSDSEALLFGAGKFMILAKEEKNYKKKINTIQKKLDRYFLKNFFGQNGFILSSTTTTKNKLLNQEDMEDDLNALKADNDNKKLNKFNLLNVEDNDILIDLFENDTINDKNSCKFCNKRMKDENLDEESCEICFNEINLGKKLTTHNYINIIEFGRLTRHKKIGKNMIKIIELKEKSYYARFSNSPKHFTWGETFDISDREYDGTTPKWSINSYIPKENHNSIKTFSDFIKKGEKTISSGLMALKADIDKLGDTFRALYKEDFRKYNRLSREVDFFFSDYITSLVSKKDNVYTVFAGGDDLFLIGEYKEIVALAKEIRDEFYKFSLTKTTISMGLVMFKPSTPINFVSHLTDEAEHRAKRERDSIDIFGVSMKYDEFIQIENDFNKVVKYLEDNKVDTTTFYYRLIELCDMKENINQNIRNAMWKSKLNYIFRRNIDKDDNDSEIFTLLSNLIEKGEKFKPSIFLKIYENKDKKE